jgi:charged multivesicular body protein 5
MDNRISDMTNKIKALDTEIQELYQKARNSRGAEQKFVKQRLLNLLKKRKMYEGQVGHYYSAQNNLDNIAFTNENIQNTIDMAVTLKESNQVQQQAMKNIDMDEMADLADQQREMQMDVQMMNEEMNRNYDNDFDEDDLDDELAELENDMKLQTLMKDGNPNAMNQQQQPQQGMKDPYL